ncbi:MAG: Asp-tRNA(Asn)/Glu-tRNA(Gln) amidotransferase subunit GatB [Mollicutes bacterium]|nr:Asp-tRNA(Asn)/Glu-tRNA(Gln) amidotransferase subunit GatB [Mollicutes bacterium]MDD7263910.1 Asp-tRNA(Asn)/Glu-tRNA(Gln) amidotransferase subunit GatB [bacterium]MDY4979563.1 Asp-tRNA(Asn)/Glu-tRNA(Gln) amidotransferase subunit GatB [Candidatus Onthovivens sp.]
MNFEAIIGLEIHVEMKTKSKMFSPAPINFSDDPNTDVTLLDMAFPGTMPVVNKEAVRNAIRMCNALHMHIDQELWFDRKNYFYSDLPKGYQITQQDRPIGSEGYLEIEIDGKLRKIEIERLHMEEDTCKQLHFSNYTLLDYNRAGIPLIEIVSKPVMHSGEEARKYVDKIRELVTFSGVSDGKMEEGSLRCDVNVSIRPYGETKFGTKVEIKNLNSIANIEKAIDYEIKRQSELLLLGQDVRQETRRFDESKKETVLMRVKTDAVDYKYFTEPNIVPIKISDEFVQDAIDTCPELYDHKLNRFINDYNLDIVDAKILLNNIEIADFFEKISSFSKNYVPISKFVITEILGYLNKNNLLIKDFKVEPKYIAEMVDLLKTGEINSSQGKEIFAKVIKENKSPIVIKKESGVSLISDEDTIRKMVIDILAANETLKADFKAGKDRVKGFIMGNLMKQTHGKVNPAIANKIIIEELKK